MKRPAFQFYPADWRKDAALQSCSIAARGVWHELLCVMHECQPYGHLSLNGTPPNDIAIARLIGVDLRDFKAAASELERAGVFSRLSDGTIFSRRMVKDEHLREVRGAAGRLGGNPKLLGDKVNQNPPEGSDLLNQVSNQVPTPSSSSSSSSSVKQKQSQRPVRINGSEVKRATRLPDDWSLPDDWQRWAQEAHAIDAQRAVRISLAFRDYWVAKPGRDACKLDWLGTWRNWVRKEVGDA